MRNVSPLYFSLMYISVGAILKQSNKNKRWFIIMRMSLLLAFACVLVGCAPQPTQTLADQHIATLQRQYEGFKQEFVVEDAKTKAQIEKNSDEVFSNPKATWEDISSSVFQSSAEIRQLYKIAGRGTMISEFLDFTYGLGANPPASLFDAWFIEKNEALKDDYSRLDLDIQNFQNSFDKKVRENADWITEIEALSRTAGTLEGKQAQLLALHQQTISYFREFSSVQQQQQEAAFRQSQALLGAAAVIGNLNYQQQLINTLNRPRTCTHFGNTFSCL